MSARNYTLFIITLFLSFTLGSTDVWAAKIKNVKGKKVLVDLEGESVEEGQIFSVLKDGKPVGLIKISKIKNNQALAVLGKGKAEAGLAIKLRSKSGGSSSARSSGPKPKGETFWGGFGGFNMSSADVTLPLGTPVNRTVNLTGSGFSAKGLYDYKILSGLWFRGLGGLEQFKVSGATDATGCNGACLVEISYISFDLWGRYLFSEGTFRPWVGGGGGLLFPMSKKSTAIQKKSITNTNIFALGGGVDWFISPTTYIPLQVEYDLYPSSSTVKATALTFRLGFAIPW